MRVTVVGTGYVGLVTGLCLADVGNEVLHLDKDVERIGSLEVGRLPIYEPGLDDVLQRSTRAGRARFTTNCPAALAWGDVILVAVGTPSLGDGRADLSAVLAVARSIAEHGQGYKVIVIKSTVPVGTSDLVARLIEREKVDPDFDFAVASNPEFLREGSAVRDFLNPSRVVVGVRDERATRMLSALYQPIVSEDRPLVLTDPRSAELVKCASNAFLAVKISFINEIADYCEVVGADVADVATGMGLDPRISPHFLGAGVGYGGSCFPKDVRALVSSASGVGVKLRIPKAAEAVNAGRVPQLLGKLRKALGGPVRGRKVAVWGVAFKPNTDDVREAPALRLMRALEAEGAEVAAYDPVVRAHNLAPHGMAHVTLCATMEEAAAGAEALVVLTEAEEFRRADMLAIAESMQTAVVVDGRNIFDPSMMEEFGITHLATGRPTRRRRVGAVAKEPSATTTPRAAAEGSAVVSP